MILPDGSIFYGSVVKMMRQGPGKMVYTNGQIFEGQFDKDQKEGVGYNYFPDGRVYCGQYRQDQEEGVGEFLIDKHASRDNFQNVNFKKIEQILDKVFKQCAQLGFSYECSKPSVKF